jgi:flavin reductase (DIM6/NTAB) family NADH-FMN oxidoreductase RutF
VTVPVDAFDELVSDLNYPMFIVTTRDGEADAGCLVGFVTQASIDPRRLLVMISKENHTYQLAVRADVLVVHFLGAGNADLAKLFGEETGDTTDKFAACEWSRGPDDVPILHGTRGWVAGRVIERLDGGDHVAHLLEATQSGLDRPDVALMFQDVRDLSPGHDA